MAALGAALRADLYARPGVGGRCILLAIVVAVHAPAFACTLCHSPQSASIRERLLQPDLWLNLGAILFPIGLLVWIVALVAHAPAAKDR
ncbi:hypothetical protein [Sphingomonas sp.]|uniref:hypothetical protein n=1 Tax=Sphingomonas sp. TaxID=28214 RepID=UPI003B3AF63B